MIKSSYFNNILLNPSRDFFEPAVYCPLQLRHLLLQLLVLLLQLVAVEVQHRKPTLNAISTN